MKKIAIFAFVSLFVFAACDSNENSDSRKSPSGILTFRTYLLGKNESISAAGDSLVSKMNKELEVSAARSKFWVRLSANPMDSSLEIVFDGELLPQKSNTVCQHHLTHCGGIGHSPAQNVSFDDAQKIAEKKAKKIKMQYKHPTVIVVYNYTYFHNEWWTTL